jgi:hypothetical protein
MIQRLIALCGASIVLAIACGSSNDNTGSSAGNTAQKLSVGSPCKQDSDCGSAPFMCMLDHPGGYCMRDCDITKGDADCPSESICQFDGMAGECHLKCNGQADCRSGYVCSPAAADPMNKASHAFCDMAP